MTTILAIAAIFIGLPVLLLWARDRTRDAGRRLSADAQNAERREYERRLLHPDWAAVERQLRRPVPSALRELYADAALVTAQSLAYGAGQTIDTFEPLDPRAMLETTGWLGQEAVAIATNEFGDVIYLQGGQDEADTVYLTHHDGGDTEVVGASVGEFVRTLKETNRRR